MRTVYLVVVATSYGILGGCASSLPSVETSSLGTDLADSAPSDLPSFQAKPVTIYSRIASAAHSCWLAPGRPLNLTHLFHANVEPQSQGGLATIVIYQRGPKANPRHRLAAMRILITPITGTSSTVEIINRRFADATAKRMAAEVRNWAGGKSGCLDIAPGKSIYPPPPSKNPLRKRQNKNKVTKK